MSLRSDFAFQRPYLTHAKRLLGEALLREGTFAEDAIQATDLITLTFQTVTIGCRIRRPRYFPRYAHQFTIRSHRDNGTQTELAKIVEGYCAYLFYGFASARQEGRLRAASLIDLDVFRRWFGDYGGQPPCEVIDNNDGTHGLAYNIADMPVGALVRTWPHFAAQEPVLIPEEGSDDTE